MKIEKLPSGSYRARKTVNGKTHSVVFDHKPTEKEIMFSFAEKITDSVVACAHITFRAAAVQYCNARSAVLSPATIRDYTKIPARLSKAFVDKYIEDITQKDIQFEINNYAKDHAPKTVRNVHGFISAVLGFFRPEMNLTTSLPTKKKFVPYTPNKSEIDLILNKAKSTPYSIPFQLGILGLRRSEIAGLKKTDLDGNYLTIHTAVVQDKNDKWVDKGNTKTMDSTRIIYIPDSLAKEIRECDKILEVIPDTLGKTLSKWQKQLGISHFRFHDLRGFYVSYAHSCGIPDKIIEKNGGWKSDYVMKTFYQRSIDDDTRYYSEAIANDLIKFS